MGGHNINHPPNGRLITGLTVLYDMHLYSHKPYIPYVIGGYIPHNIPVDIPSSPRFSWFSRQPTRYSEPRHTAATVGWRRVLLPCCTTVVSGATQLADNVENSGSCKAPHGGQCLDGSNSLGKEWNGKDDSDRS